ncbi:thiamine phosphate synthase [Burkholderia sp. Ax-1724]|nr:thiamine phosphate synthase [Burkholderia sp. Ax-1724]NIF55892.1 thiamine phosphate synthase [Burkholderia sp. Ax-1724]
MKASALPDFYQITPEPIDPPHFDTFLRQLAATLEAGIQLVQLRAKHLEKHDHLNLARRTRDLCRQHGAMLMLNGPIEMAVEIGCDGVHLNSHALMSLKEPPAHDAMLVSAACHSAGQLAQANKIGADFVTLSPVLPTRTHPDATPLGWQHFGQLVAGSRVPVFALGGMTPALLDEARKAGAWGIAAISAGWRGDA